tara:strand:+ start:181 stop:585 length:405 start_codon:yes stop_codon:yes gene_type:complete
MKSKFDSAVSAEKKMKELNRQLEFQVEELMEQLNTADDARKSLKGELNLSNNKVIQIEEELYGSKTVQKDLLDKLKESEDAQEDMLNDLEQAKYKNDSLEYINSQIKNQIYHSDTKDSVDVALGKFVNTYPERD